jgi:hypothetical protein
MRAFLIAFTLLAGACFAQTGEADRNRVPGNGQEKEKPTGCVRRLESVMWEPLQGQLTWVVSVWDLGSDMSHPSELERYVIHVNAGTMDSKGEQRAFEVPKTDLHALMDILSIYAMRCTIWWERGPADPGTAPAIVPDDDKPKEDAPKEKPKSTPSGKAAADSAQAAGVGH